jgi:hypothetical protein
LNPEVCDPSSCSRFCRSSREGQQKGDDKKIHKQRVAENRSRDASHEVVGLEASEQKREEEEEEEEEEEQEEQEEEEEEACWRELQRTETETETKHRDMED